MKTKEEILKEATKRTLNINEGSPLHDAVMKAMEKYAALQQPAVMRSVLADLRNRLEISRQLTHLFDEDEARWRDGMESGLETAIEFLEDALKKHFS